MTVQKEPTSKVKFVNTSPGKAFVFGLALWGVWFVWVVSVFVQTWDLEGLESWNVMLSTLVLNSLIVFIAVWNVKRTETQPVSHKLWVSGLGGLGVLSLVGYGTVLFF